MVTSAHKVISTNLQAMSEMLIEASQLATDGYVAAGKGNQMLAIGTIMPIEQLLKDAATLFDAALALQKHAK